MGAQLGVKSDRYRGMRFLLGIGLLVLSSTAFGAELDYERLVKMIQEKDLRSANAVIDQIKQESPEFMDAFTLMEKSRAPETITKEFPRLVASNKDGSLMIALTTDPENPEYNVMQVARMPQGGTKPDFYEIEFAQAGETGKPVFRDGKPGHEEKPSTCTSCHSNGYIWETSALWPGSMQTYAKLTDTERADLLKYAQEKKNDPRLKHFVARILERKAAGKEDLLNSANQRITENIYGLAKKDLAARLRAHPAFEANKALILAALSACSGLDSFVPPALLASKKPLTPVLEATVYAIRTHADRNAGRARDGAPAGGEAANGDMKEAARTGGTRWAMAEFLGLNLDNSSPAREGNSYVFSDGKSHLETVARELNGGQALPSCDTLKSRSLASLAQVPGLSSGSSEVNSNGAPPSRPHGP
jgi:hypothetical protein